MDEHQEKKWGTAEHAGAGAAVGACRRDLYSEAYISEADLDLEVDRIITTLLLQSVYYGRFTGMSTTKSSLESI
jgi:hypothetical protein